MGSWSLAHLQGSGENRSEGPSKRAQEDSDTSWVPALCGPSPFQAASVAGHIVHTTDFILSCHLRLKTYLCPGWCASELCSELLASVLKRKRKKKFYLQDSVDGIHLQTQSWKEEEGRELPDNLRKTPFRGKRAFGWHIPCGWAWVHAKLAKHLRGCRRHKGRTGWWWSSLYPRSPRAGQLPGAPAVGWLGEESTGSGEGISSVHLC